MKRGHLITFEGPEGSGKSTHLRLLGDYLENKRGRRVVVTREPGGTALAAGLRALLLGSREPVTPWAELFLYEADRAQHVETCIKPALRQGMLVLCDRYTDSTLAYQGDGRGLARRDIERLNAVACQGLWPDLTILLDVPVERGLRQAHAKKGGHDRLEKAGLAFHRRVRRGFLRQAKAEPKRFRVIAQETTVEKTQARVRAVVERFLSGGRA